MSFRSYKCNSYRDLHKMKVPIRSFISVYSVLSQVEIAFLLPNDYWVSLCTVYIYNPLLYLLMCSNKKKHFFSHLSGFFFPQVKTAQPGWSLCLLLWSKRKSICFLSFLYEGLSKNKYVIDLMTLFFSQFRYA
jgi:hypothetical protein